MSDTTSTATQNTDTQEPKIASIGKVQRVEMTFPQGNSDTQQNNDDAAGTENGNKNINTEGANATNANNGAAASTENAAPAPTPITDEALKEYFKSQGIDYEGVDKLKEQLKPKEANSAPTEAEIQAKELAKEKRLLDKFISGKGTAEQYVALKGVANADPNKFALDMAKTDLMKGGLTLEEAEIYVKEHLGMVDDTELERLEDESDRAFKKRQKEFNAKLLAANSNPHIEKAKWVLQNLNEAIEAEDLQVQNELTTSANIDEQFKKVNLKDTYEIGKINGKDIPPVESEVSEAEIAAVHAMLKDPEQRKQYFQNPDGSQNYTKLTELLIENAKLKAAVKTSYHESSTRNNAHWATVFPARSAQELGVGGNTQKPNGQNGQRQPVSVGKVQRVMPQRQTNV